MADLERWTLGVCGPAARVFLCRLAGTEFAGADEIY
jgi:hypothetical protein